jgi:hypothetical protein
MKKAHVALLALLFAGVAVLGAVAVTRTKGLGHAARRGNDVVIATRTKQLSAFAAKLRRELRAKPPALPAVPKRPQPVPQLTAPRVVYHQPPPVVVTVHHRHGDDGSREADGGGDD